MHSIFRRVPALIGALTFVLLMAPTAGAATFNEDELSVAPAGQGRHVGVAPAPCEDPAFNQIATAWKGNNYTWSFDAATTPGYLKKAEVAAVLNRSFSNITDVHNDCGLPDNVSATHTYLGTTSTAAKCGKRDGQNVVGFHKLPFGVLAVTCYWTKNGHMVEADVQINRRESWALRLKGCFAEVMLEATVTHEAGHVFGLGHVSERRHGRLTMSPYIDGPCQNNESTLGLGDIRGLEAIY